MEEKLKKLLEDLKNQETSRKDIINEIQEEIGRVNFREESETEKLVENMRADIASGLYNDRTDGQIEKLMDELKNEIKQRYAAERNQLNQKIEDAQKQEEMNIAKDYKQINSSIKEYHIGMVLEASKAKRELAKMEEEQNQKIQEIDKIIAEKEAKRTHMIMLNRKYIDIESNQALADIKLLEIEIEKLKEQRQGITGEYASKIEEQNKYLQYCIQQKERAAKFIGQISLSKKSIDEIRQILFEGIEPVIEEQPIVEEAEPAIIEEQPKVEEVEPAIIEEQPKVEEVQPVIVEEEQPIVEEVQPVIVEEEQPIVEEVQPVIEEEEQLKVEEVEPAIVEEEQPIVEEVESAIVEEKQPIVEKVQTVIVEERPIHKEVQPVVAEEPEIIRPKPTTEQDRNYKYFEQNKKSIIEFFIEATGIKAKEAKEIFNNKQYCTTVGEICRKAMQKKVKDRDELCETLEDYYLSIDSRLDIEVSTEGITYNDETIEPLDVTSFGNNEIQFIDKIIWKYKDTIPKFRNSFDNVIYDKNIIMAIAMDNCKESSDGKLKLTASGKKKLNQYLNLIADPSYSKGAVTYNLKKMSILKGFFNYSEWPAKTIREFREIAYQAKDTYAEVVPGFMDKLQWAIQDKIKGFKTKRLKSGEEQTELETNMENNNSWELREEQKAYANSRSTKSNGPKVTEPEKEECK